MDRNLLIFTAIVSLTFLSTTHAIDFDPGDAATSRSLNGTWQFKLIERDNQSVLNQFYRPDTENLNWDSIEVPSNWEMQGFEEPHYVRADETKVGLYRKAFTLPSSWQGQHVFIDLQGVSFGYTLWLNGQRMGRYDHAFLPCQFDLTRYLRWEDDNVLALQVDRDQMQSHLDNNDAWALSGIYRDATLFCLPETYIHEVCVQTSIDKVARAAAIQVGLEIRFFRQGHGRPLQVGPHDLRLHYQVIDPAGQVVADQQEPVDCNNGNVFPWHEILLDIKEAAFWTAETPALYQLKLTLSLGDTEVHHLTQTVGLREVSVVGNVLCINGQPVKLRGVCRHEIHPEVGRALREGHWRRDIMMMKAANINSVRCSHYPPHPRFLELCDEVGLYVLDEIPAGFGDRFLNDPAMLGPLLSRAHRTVMRDRNHPSVIIWDIGNENPLVDNLNVAATYVKHLDSTRPILFPGSNFNGSPYDRTATGENAGVDIFAPHYPTNQEIAAHLDDTSAGRPILYTEICHALDQGFGDFAAKWDMIESQDKMAGAHVWLWADQALKRQVNGRAVAGSHRNIHALKGAAALSGDVWLNEQTVLDSHGQYGTDGVVYGDRQPQTDYFQLRRVYRPIVVSPDTVTVASEANQIVELTLVNRFDFLNLSQVKATWILRFNGEPVQQGELTLYCLPHDRQKMNLTINAPTSLAEGECQLQLLFRHLDGCPIDEKVVRLLSKAGPANWSTQLPQQNKPVGVWQVDETGLLTAQDLDGRLLVRGPWVRIGREPSMAERRTYERLHQRIWEPAVLRSFEIVQRREFQDETGRVVEIEACYTDQDRDMEQVTAQMRYHWNDEGGIDLDYDLSPNVNDGALLEFGLVFEVLHAKSVSWIGQGPFPCYPQKQALSQRGLYHLRPDDRFFAGNRLGVDVVLVHTGVDRSIAMIDQGANMLWEPGEAGFIVGHNARVAGLGTKFQPPQTRYLARELKETSGHLQLMILAGDPGSDGLRFFQGR